MCFFSIIQCLIEFLISISQGYFRGANVTWVYRWYEQISVCVWGGEVSVFHFLDSTIPAVLEPSGAVWGGRYLSERGDAGEGGLQKMRPHICWKRSIWNNSRSDLSFLLQPHTGTNDCLHRDAHLRVHGEVSVPFLLCHGKPGLLDFFLSSKKVLRTLYSSLETM